MASPPPSHSFSVSPPAVSVTKPMPNTSQRRPAFCCGANEVAVHCALAVETLKIWPLV